MFHEVIIDRNDLMVILQWHDQTSTQGTDTCFLTIHLTYNTSHMLGEAVPTV